MGQRCKCLIVRLVQYGNTGMNQMETIKTGNKQRSYAVQEAISVGYKQGLCWKATKLCRTYTQASDW